MRLATRAQPGQLGRLVRKAPRERGESRAPKDPRAWLVPRAPRANRAVMALLVQQVLRVRLAPRGRAAHKARKAPRALRVNRVPGWRCRAALRRRTICPPARRWALPTSLRPAVTCTSGTVAPGLTQDRSRGRKVSKDHKAKQDRKARKVIKVRLARKGRKAKQVRLDHKAKQEQQDRKDRKGLMDPRVQLALLEQ